MLYPSFLKSENSASIFIIFLKTDEFFTALPQIIDTIFSCRHPLIIRYPHSLISQTDLSVHHICGNRLHHIISQNHFATELSVSQFVFGNPTHFFRSYNQIVILYFILYIHVKTDMIPIAYRNTMSAFEKLPSFWKPFLSFLNFFLNSRTYNLNHNYHNKDNAFDCVIDERIHL